MKNLIILLFVVTLFSCDKEVEKSSYVLLNGSVSNSEAETVSITGSDFEAKIPIENGAFADTLDIKVDGYYSLRIGRESTSMYLEQGNAISILVDTQKFDETIAYSGEGAAASNYLAAKYLLSETEKSFQDVYSLPENDFLKEANSYNDMYAKLLKETHGIPEEFISKETKELAYTHAMNLENYQEYYRYLTPEKEFEVSDSFYSNLGDISYADTTAYRSSPGYQRMLSTHFSRLSSEAVDADGTKNQTVEYLTLVSQDLPNGYAKDKLMFDFLQFGLTPDSSLSEAYEIYKNSATDGDDLKKVTERYTLLKTLLEGQPSPEFAYENHAGGATSLADLEGKYVYIDVWATWCGPCIREIPSLKEVEKDYHDKNIAFVSISIDTKKDYQKWRDMVVEKELGGVQLMADNDWKSEFVTKFGILGIPRFILLDSEGNIISADAPRPSNPKLREMLQELI